jgi:hypothetical protein
MLLAGVSANAQLAPGSVAPNFTVTAYQPLLSTAGMNNNGSYTLYDYLDQGYTVFLDVSATWCGPCWNYHLGGALEDIYAAHGPAGAPGVSSSTTDDVMVIWVEGDGQTDDATMLDGSGAIGNWIEPAAGNQIQFPMANPASAVANQINNDYAIAYFPTIYRICPNRIIEEVGQLGASALYATVAACPPPASAPADVAAAAYLADEARVMIRLEGFGPSVSSRASLLRDLLARFGKPDEQAGLAALQVWGPLHRGQGLAEASTLWRISVPRSAGLDVGLALDRLNGRWMADWAGGLIWCETHTAPDEVRALAAKGGGHAMLVRAPEDMRAQVSAFHPQSRAMAALSERVRRAFDPYGLFETGRFPDLGHAD